MSSRGERQGETRGALTRSTDSETVTGHADLTALLECVFLKYFSFLANRNRPASCSVVSGGLA